MRWVEEFYSSQMSITKKSKADFIVEEYNFNASAFGERHGLSTSEFLIYLKKKGSDF